MVAHILDLQGSFMVYVLGLDLRSLSRNIRCPPAGGVKIKVLLPAGGEFQNLDSY